MTEIMQSIRPEWCSLIASGKKTIEVRKTRPKCETPFKVYIYCTKNGNFLVQSKTNPAYSINKIEKYGGKVIGEYVCDDIFKILADYAGNCGDDCLSYSEREAYLGDYGMGYGYHISDLKIYDTPLELSDFIHPSSGCVNEGKCNGCRFLDRGIDGIIEDDCLADFDTDIFSVMKRAPQDWCYVRRVE